MTGGHSHLKTFPGRSGLCVWRWENVFLEIFDQPVKVVNLANEHERLQWREKLGEVLSEKTLYVSEVTLTNIHLLIFRDYSSKHSPLSLFLQSGHTNACRWWTSMSLYQKCQTRLILSWSLTPVSTTCSPIFSRSLKQREFFLDLDKFAWQVCHSTANMGSPGVGINMVRRLLRDTLAI